MFVIRCHRLALIFTLGLLLISAADALADEPNTPIATVTIVNPSAGAVVGGEAVRIENRVTHPANVVVRAVKTQVAEIGAHALTLPLSAERWAVRKDGKSVIYPESWNTLPMHNGECRITTRVVCQQGEKRFTVISQPVTVTVKNLWITKASPATAFFAVKVKETQAVTVNFDHYKATGPYRVEYSFRMPIANDKVFRTIIHDNITAHHDSCTFTADKESLPFGAYVCFNVKVTCGNDAATLITPMCKVIQDDAEVLEDQDVRIVYALSEPPKTGGLTILCYSDLNLISLQEGLSEQCRDWEHPVIIPFHETTSFRSIFVGSDNQTDNRGRTPQPIMPKS